MTAKDKVLAVPAHGHGKCLECGGPLPTMDYKGRERKFCSTEHRKAWNNRRMIRGAVLYDEIMRWRYARNEAKDAITTLAQVASVFRGKDVRNRGGRRSWINDPNRDTLTSATEVE